MKPLGKQEPAQTGAQRRTKLGSLPVWAHQAGSVACQSRENTTSPPAAAGPFSRCKARSILRLGQIGAALALSVLLAACTASPPQAAQGTAAASQSEPAEQVAATPYSAAPATPEPNPTAVPENAAEQPKATSHPSEAPKPEVEESADFAGVAYEAQDGDEAAIQRSGDKVSEADRMRAAAESKTRSAYGDGLSIIAEKVADGTVKSEGPGYFTGAPYVVFELEVVNGSDAEVDLSSVVVGLRLDRGADAALPLYGEIEAYDFAGSLQPGEKTSTKYGFIVPKGRTSAELTVDLDSAHAPAAFEVKAG